MMELRRSALRLLSAQDGAAATNRIAAISWGRAIARMQIDRSIDREVGEREIRPRTFGERRGKGANGDRQRAMTDCLIVPAEEVHEDRCSTAADSTDAEVIHKSHTDLEESSLHRTRCWFLCLFFGVFFSSLSTKHFWNCWNARKQPYQIKATSEVEMKKHRAIYASFLASFSP